MLLLPSPVLPRPHIMKILVLLIGILLTSLNVFSQKTNSNLPVWRAVITRPDGKEIVFNFQERRQGSKTVIYIQNSSERILVDSVRFRDDSVFIKMPVFESAFKAKVTAEKWNGVWTKGTSRAEQLLPFTAEKSKIRYPLTNGPSEVNVNGRWAVRFATDTSKEGSSIAELKQVGNKVTGTFITPTGDYRYMEGVVTGNKLEISGFDGGHAVLFTGELNGEKKIENGYFYSGAKYREGWSAVKNQKATVKQDESAMYLKPGEDKLSFAFPDINGNRVSINDDRFRNKVVVIQLMGSWCPNCMDETQFLSGYYNKNKQRGVEVIALAYEYSTDFNRSQQSLKKFQQRFAVNYPILITGVTVSDSLRTEKTLPQVTRIKVFPSSIILDKKGKVRKLDNSFYGPGTGEHYETYKKEFYETIDGLLNEK